MQTKERAHKQKNKTSEDQHLKIKWDQFALALYCLLNTVLSFFKSYYYTHTPINDPNHATQLILVIH